jgi:hypothetical protein
MEAEWEHSTRLHGLIYQNTVIFISTAVITEACGVSTCFPTSVFRFSSVRMGTLDLHVDWNAGVVTSFKHSSPSLIRIIKSIKMRWARHVARMGRRMHIEFWWESQKERDHFEDLDVGRRKILRLILER